VPQFKLEIVALPLNTLDTDFAPDCYTYNADRLETM
jgi:hypothetical protein